MNAKEKMVKAIESRTTEQLFSDLEELDRRRVNGVLVKEEERLVSAMISDAIENRHHLTEALDAIFTDDYAGSYTDALKLAYVATVKD